MIEEIQKRPFVRPLFLWIAGILLQLIFPDCNLSVLLLFSSGTFLLLAFCFEANGNRCCYNYRWTWGFVFSCLLITSSMFVTAGVERQDNHVSPAVIQQFAMKEQSKLADSFDCLHLTDEEKSVLATITLGYRQAMNPEVKRNFSTAGVAHILAVSGFHVAIVCGFLSIALGFLPKNRAGRWTKYILVVVLLWSFVCVTGMAASTVRAGCMLSFYLTGKVLRRTTDSYNTLAAAAFCMLVYDPFYLFDIGFQLSYIAVFFILYLQPSLRNFIYVRNPLLSIPWNWITITIAAQVGTALLCLFYFGRSSSVFLFTNLPLTFIATMLIPMAFLWLMLPQWFPGLDWLQRGVEILTQWMVKIVDAFSHIPGAMFIIQLDFVSLIVCYAILLSSLLYLRLHRPVWLLLSLSLLLIIMFAEVIKRYYVS
ncbi:competence protein ComEC [Parabacteroides chinchillae]|uniref:Competence protein ComEC n=2 Tax=Parabacteroides chinchillae TaxID=871327 RepID=A0A8G2BTI3_9BACT|nr:competence protein ComEC [Parabacteroides chinchillae]